MNREREFIRPDLSGYSFGDVKLGKRIGRGGFGDVYVSPDCKVCIKVVFRDLFSAQENYEKELEAVSFVSSCIREHCGIAKFLGCGRTDKNFNYAEPFHPCGGIPTDDVSLYQNYPVTTDSFRWESKQWKEEKHLELFYYFMLAADNLEKPPEYLPDTLENRRPWGILRKMSDEEKMQVLAEIIDSLLFLYRLRICEAPMDKGEMFHVIHGDIKPSNIFFVNGHAQLGDLGASMRINPDGMPVMATPEFLPTENEWKMLREKCGNDYFAFSVFLDIYALGKTARYLQENGEQNEFFRFSVLSEIVDELCSFHQKRNVLPGNVIEKLSEFRNRSLPWKNHFRDQFYYGTAAPGIVLNDLSSFSRLWNVTEAESVKRFRVTNVTSNWKQYSDVLLAERFPWKAEPAIREKETEMLKKNQQNGRPLLIFRLKKPREIIVLSHSRKAFSPSPDALGSLRSEIREAEENRDDFEPGF